MDFFFDIGASKIKIGWSRNSRKIEGFKILDNPENYKDFLNLIKNNLWTYDVHSCVFAFPGVFDKQKEKLIYSPNLKDFENRNLKKDLKNILKTKIILENDALLAGLGEAVYGAGKNYKIVTYITLSTGIGGARIVNKRPDEKFFGFEPGHSLLLNIFCTNKNQMYYQNENRIFDYNLNKAISFEVENLISSSAIQKIFNKKPEEIKDKKIWRSINYLTSIFLVNTALFWSPEVVILGGGMMKSLDIDLIRKNFNKLLPFKIKLKIIKSKLQNLSAIYGGLAYLKIVH